ncbi:hypothetical protein SAMN06265218_101390 [Fodinibius sediminis]|uniref:Uncharacterized protein n=1 Tax=Fodinibius sediminis TaxID=1214077 RepID=A0A521AUX7_9BACT|nr:hypothetical protein SAMN06265218_101390 [Fodinibius sediminis]
MSATERALINEVDATLNLILTSFLNIRAIGGEAFHNIFRKL